MTDLRKFSARVRADILKMIHNAQSGHPGGCLSCVEIISVLYNKILKIDPKWDKSPTFKTRNRFILSKGHASATLYSVLANLGFFPHNELMGFRGLGTRVQGHPSSRIGLEGIEVSTGSLGQGLSMGVGMALGMRLDKIDAKVFVVMGDGEMQEGSVWEALMSASSQKLDNIVAIIDKNDLQIDGKVSQIKCIDPLDKKLEAFGWEVVTVNGHDENELEEAYKKAVRAKKPFAVIAKTVKGKGVSFMEDVAGWHGKALNDKELEMALGEIGVS